jgi:hypothetical protein
MAVMVAGWDLALGSRKTKWPKTRAWTDGGCYEMRRALRGRIALHHAEAACDVAVLAAGRDLLHLVQAKTK